MVSSPYVRAVQTAELLAVAIGYQGPIESNSAFTPDSSPARAAEELLAMGPGTILVTHEPLVSTVAGILSGSSQPGFSTAEMACIADGSLAWRLRN